MKKLFATAFAATTFAAAILAVPTPASAQFSMSSIPGVGKSGGGAPAADLSGQQDALVRNFVVASKEVLTANSRMADALGLKTEAAKSSETAGALAEGASSGNLSDSNKVVADTSGAIKESLAKKPVLDAEAKAKYADGMVHLVAGSIKYAGLGKDVQSMGAGLKGASPLQMAKLSSAAYVVSKFPGSATDLFGTLKAAVAFCKEQGIKLPTNTNDALGALGGLNGG